MHNIDPSLLHWDSTGRCWYPDGRFESCTGPRGQGCEGRWEDEFGSARWCASCMGSGKEHKRTYVRVPEFDSKESCACGLEVQS